MNGGKYLFTSFYILKPNKISHYLEEENDRGKQRSYTDRTRFEQKYLIKFV